jgi:hypothetical protein
MAEQLRTNLPTKIINSPIPIPNNPYPAIPRFALVAAQLGFQAGNGETESKYLRYLEQIYPLHSVAGVPDAIETVGMG